MNLIPKEKIKCLRMGQLIINAIGTHYDLTNDIDIAGKLFYMENNELEEVIQKYLEDYDTQTSDD